MDSQTPPATTPPAPIPASLPPAARWLGYAGLLPQLLCLALATGIAGLEAAYVAMPAGFAYSAAIFSFLGGVWWGQAMTSDKHGAGAYVISVMPSLLAVALFIPWNFGWEWPGPALLYLGVLIALSPLVDRAFGFAAKDFLGLRAQLSVGLGLLTVALGVVALL
jgi:hypothetical protein